MLLLLDLVVYIVEYFCSFIHEILRKKVFSTCYVHEVEAIRRKLQVVKQKKMILSDEVR